jgi:hypothetical protein
MFDPHAATVLVCEERMSVLEESRDVIYVRRDDVLLRDVAGEHLLVPIRRNVADLQAIFALNGIGVYIWSLLDGARTMAAILAAIQQRYDVSADEAAADLQAFLDGLTQAGVVELRRP